MAELTLVAAGMPIEKVNGSKTSVYTGSFADDYRTMTMKDPEGIPTHAATGTSISILANRLSWFFNFKGPSVHLDSACSSSMMALDIACQGLRNDDSDMSLVAGSNTAYALEQYLLLANMNMLSADGRCYSFDDRANGYARGEGFGVLVLKRLVDAIKDGDTIRAVIRSTGCNSDGRTPGITQPSGDAQEALIRETYSRAGLDLGSTRFFEAHGTGTALGDPTEASGIGAAFGKFRSPDEPLYVGAVKSNIGHLEGASGVAGIIKTILALEKGVIPPNTNFERMNPRIDAPGLNIRFPTQALPWPTPGLRRASVNSFGFGGSNAHVVLDDAYNYLKFNGISGFHNTAQTPPTPDQLALSLGKSVLHNNPLSPVENGFSPEGGVDLDVDESQPKILVWSAADEGGVKRLATVYSDHFKSLTLAPSERNEYLSDLAYTLAERRSVLPWKSFAITHSMSQLQTAGVSPPRAVRSKMRTGIAFVFTGQGAQFAGMGRNLLVYPIFKRTLQRAELYFQDMGCSWSLMDELFKEQGLSNVNNPEFSQSLCTALQIALIELLRSFNITPNAVVGHSSGEIAAAYCTGAISFRSACKIAYFRGKLSALLMKTAKTQGAMIAVALSEAQARSYILRVASKFGGAGMVVACINSPKSVTVSGDENQVDALKLLLDEDSVFSRKLQVDVAYHSPHMEQIAADYRHALMQLELGEQIPGCKTMMSSVINVPVTSKDLCSADYWVKNLTNPVRFSDAITKLASGASKKKLGGGNPESVVVYDLLELGPHSALAGPTKDILKAIPRGNEIVYSSCLSRNVSALETTLSAVGKLWCLGYAVNIAAVNRSELSKTSCNNKGLSDLPEYPFDHSQSYWQESRTNKELRLRDHPHLDLLGTRSLDWNSLDARWRKFIRLSETPWAEDHIVNGALVYPAAGMLVMAIEGVRQLVGTSDNRLLKGYRIKEVFFQRVLSIPSSAEGVESQLSLRPIQSSIDKDTSKFDFSILSISDGTWGENCHGVIQVEYEGSTNEVDAGYEDNSHSERSVGHFRKQKDACTRPIDNDFLYDHFNRCGLEFGPCFQTLSNVSYHEGKVVAEVKTFDWETVNDTNHSQPHLIHPTTLDALIQVVLVGHTRGAQDTNVAKVPTRMSNLWLSASGLCYTEAKSLRATSNHLTKGHRQSESSFLAIDDNDVVRAYVDVLEMTKVDHQHEDSDSDKSQRKLCYSMVWKPDFDLMTPDQAQLYCEVNRNAETSTTAFYKDLHSFIHTTISNLLLTIDPTKVDPAKIRYLDRMKTWVGSSSNGDLLHAQPSDVPHFDSLARNLESSNEGKFYVEVSKHLAEILYSELDPAEVLIRSNIAIEQRNEFNSRLTRQLSKLIDLLAHKNPRMKVLEVGAGMSNTTQSILEPLFSCGNDEGATPRCSQYDLTDSSAVFIQKAQETFQQYGSRMKYNMLDVESDVLTQGFVAGTYDLIVAAHNLHATKDMDRTLSNIRSLLRPGGKFVLLEQTGNAARSAFALGLLPEWWKAADKYRSADPIIGPEELNRALRNNGFTGADLVFNDYETPICQELSIVVSTALESSPPQMSLPKTMVIVPHDSKKHRQIADQIQSRLYHMCSPTCEIVSLDEAVTRQDVSERFCISLLELDSPILHDIDQRTFEDLKTVLGSVPGLIWVTSGGGLVPDKPEYQTADGLLRTLQSENTMLKAVSLALRPGKLEPEANAETIFRILTNTLSKDVGEFENEYVDRAGTLTIPRVVEANYMNDHIQKSAEPQETLLQPFGAPGIPPLALQFETPGLLDSLRFIEDEVAKKPLRPGEIEIEVKATGVNFMDCHTALGRINQTEIGGECAGVITQSSGESDLKPGDRVCGIVFDCFKSLARCDPRCVVRIPDGMSFLDAAALPMACTTAYQALMTVGRLQQGETVLIHTAAGGIGQIAMQLCRHVGAEVFATVGSQEKKQLIMDLYGIPSDHILYSRDTTFAQGVKRMTNGRGVDLVLNSLAGEGLAASWECMASFGRFVDIGKRDIHAHSKLDMSHFAKNVSYAAVDVLGMYHERPDLVGRALSASMSIVAEGKVHASKPVHTYTVSQIEDAFRYMQSGKNVGKIVIDMKKDDTVRVS